MGEGFPNSDVPFSGTKPGRIASPGRIFYDPLDYQAEKDLPEVETIYDWVTILGFAGLVTLFLQRSSLEVSRDSIWQYLPPSIGFAATNYFGNEGMDVVAIALGIVTVVYIFVVLKPQMRT